ncbi:MULTISPECIES: hypothetical protein [unclassified Micromonospora]|uniref:hypothetical protein n=1 Tax=unclassified Micromonospora TaxID=2617518 RepID=UPI003A841453
MGPGTYTDAVHTLRNAHELRELVYVVDTATGQVADLAAQAIDARFVRIRDRRADYLRFITDPAVPFDNRLTHLARLQLPGSHGPIQLLRYPAAGGLNAAARARRQAVRERAVATFVEDRPTAEIASELRVSGKSVRGRRRRWIVGGVEALASAGPGGADCKLTAEQRRQLVGFLDEGPVVHGWDEARWTLARSAAGRHP